MTDEQADMLFVLLKAFKGGEQPGWEFFHGDCVGADEQAHELARFLGYRVTIFPPLNETKRAFCNAHETRPAKEYLERDRDIVDECDILLAAIQYPIKPRSGSWYTYRYALDHHRRAWRL